MINYNDEIVKKFTIASIFWLVAGLAAGLLISFQMVFPSLNFEPLLIYSGIKTACLSILSFNTNNESLILKQRIKLEINKNKICLKYIINFCGEGGI